jgi:ubiquinone/menaquinone biosynthesis C-methylase UbiE
MSEHRERILDQFTRQAVPFSTAPSIRDAGLIGLLVEASEPRARDRVLDVACGPGLVVQAFAERAAHVVGIDVVPAMLERAREVLADRRNVELTLGDVGSLPFADQSFDIVVSRFAFHHFHEPVRVLREMRRVCRAGGRVLVCDLLGSEDSDKAAAFHALEMRRDPSHARAHTLGELSGYFTQAGLTPEIANTFRLPFELESLLARSFPEDGDRNALRTMYLQKLDGDGLGLHLQRVGHEIHGAYDVVILRASCHD